MAASLVRVSHANGLAETHLTPMLVSEACNILENDERFGSGFLEGNVGGVQAGLAGAFLLKAGVVVTFRPKLTVSSTAQEERIANAVVEKLKQQEEPRPKGFSSVGSTEAEKILRSLNLTEVDGNLLYPIDAPKDQEALEPFDFSKYPNEDAGTPHFLKYHQAQLEKFGVAFGEGGFQVVDVHSKGNMCSFRSREGQVYQGHVDGIVSPYGVRQGSAASQCRIAFEHKQAEEDKQKYREEHPEEYPDLKKGSASRAIDVAHKGQAVISTIGTYAYNSFPAIMDLTDGRGHALFKIQGDELQVWSDCSPSDAYWMMSEHLKSNSLLKRRTLKPEDVPEEEQGPMKRCRGLVPESALKEQLDSVVPFLPENERLDATFDIMQSWASAAPLELSPEILRMIYT